MNNLVASVILFFTAIALADIPINFADPTDNSVVAIHPDSGLDINVQRNVFPPGVILPENKANIPLMNENGDNNDFIAPRNRYDPMPRYHVYPRVDDMPGCAFDPTIDAKILKVYPHIGIGLSGPRTPQRYHKHLPFKK